MDCLIFFERVKKGTLKQLATEEEEEEFPLSVNEKYLLKKMSVNIQDLSYNTIGLVCK